MGTLTSFVGALFVGRRRGKGSTGFCWINIMMRRVRVKKGGQQHVPEYVASHVGVRISLFVKRYNLCVDPYAA